jgi:large subunit ribosomal protein L25
VIFNLVIENGGTQNVTAMVKEVQAAPVTRQYLHIDFYEISLDEEIVVNIAVEVTGKSKGVERGGFLNVVRYELEVSCLPTDMPDNIQIDVTDLDIGDSIHVEDLAVMDKVKLLADPGLTVLTVVAPTIEEEELPEEEELEEGEEVEGEEAEAPEEASTE